jgi:hypothetical protein
MLNLLFSFALNLVVSVAPSAPAQCETYAPRIDGISVTVCAGSVVKACDAFGTCTR